MDHDRVYLVQSRELLTDLAVLVRVSGVEPQWQCDEERGWFWIGHNNRISVVRRNGSIVIDLEGCGPFYEILSTDSDNVRVVIFELFVIIFDRDANILKRIDCDVIQDYSVQSGKICIKDVAGKHYQVKLNQE
jgi:hypothetical protein